MNIKKQAEKLERYLDEEFKVNLPVVVLSDKSLVYKNFKIKQDKRGYWILGRVGGNVVDKFNLKACALIAARFYSANNLNKYNEIKNLDTEYQKNSNDSEIFKYIYKKTSDSVKKDTCLWRWEISDQKARYAKSQIVTKFKLMF